jgi:hypothetical protein
MVKYGSGCQSGGSGLNACGGKLFGSLGAQNVSAGDGTVTCSCPWSTTTLVQSMWSLLQVFVLLRVTSAHSLLPVVRHSAW